MRRARFALAAALLAGLVAGEPWHRLTAVERDLLRRADVVAEGDHGRAVHVRAVHTTQGEVAAATGRGGGRESSAGLWVVQLWGSDYACFVCPTFKGGPVRGRYVTLYLPDDGTFGTGLGIHDEPERLDRMGDVVVLRG